jgi:hypothetical protein
MMIAVEIHAWLQVETWLLVLACFAWFFALYQLLMVTYIILYSDYQKGGGEEDERPIEPDKSAADLLRSGGDDVKQLGGFGQTDSELQEPVVSWRLVRRVCLFHLDKKFVNLRTKLMFILHGLRPKSDAQNAALSNPENGGTSRVAKFSVSGWVSQKTANFQVKTRPRHAPIGAARRILHNALRSAAGWVRRVRALPIPGAATNNDMSEQELSTSCAYCDGKFNFPNEGVGMVTPCPHCDEKVVLGVPTKKTIQRSKPAPPLTNDDNTKYELARIRDKTRYQGFRSTLNLLQFFAGGYTVIVLLSAFAGEWDENEMAMLEHALVAIIVFMTVSAAKGAGNILADIGDKHIQDR